MKNIIILTDENFDLIINEEPKFVLVDFWADWCGPCKLMEPILNEIIKNYENKNILFAKLDIDKNPNITLKYTIRGIPSFLLFYKNKLQDNKIGTLSKEELIIFLNNNFNKINL